MESNATEDSRLIALFKKGDKKAFGVLYEKYRLVVLNYFIANDVPMEDAVDACHDIFVKLMKYLNEVDLEWPFKTFLNSIIRNKLADIYRQKKRSFIRIRHELRDSELIWVKDNSWLQNNFDELQEDKDFEKEYEFEEVVAHCLKRIKKERWRMIIQLWMENFKREQISKLLDVPIGTVCSCLSRVRPEFLECIKNQLYSNKIKATENKKSKP